MELLTCFLFLSFALFHHECYAGLTQRAEFFCSISGSEFVMTFNLYKNRDNIDLVYAVRARNVNLNSMGKFDSNGNGIGGNGTENFPFTFRVAVNGTVENSHVILAKGENTDKMARVEGDDVLRIDVMSKSQYTPNLITQLIYAKDVVYLPVCNFTRVFLDELSKNAPENTQPILEAIVSKTVRNTVTVGEKMKLRLSIPRPTNVTGVLIHSGQICDVPDCNGAVAVDFLDTFGCRTKGFMSHFASTNASVWTTEEFEVFNIIDQSNVYFQCHVNVCYDANDTLCDIAQYCDVETGQRKTNMTLNVSPVSDITKPIQLTLNIQGASGIGVTLSRLTGLSPDENVMLLAAVTSLAALLVVFLIIAIVAYRRFRRKKISPD